jgi:hypothetical protein
MGGEVGERLFVEPVLDIFNLLSALLGEWGALADEFFVHAKSVHLMYISGNGWQGDLGGTFEGRIIIGFELQRGIPQGLRIIVCDFSTAV